MYRVFADRDLDCHTRRGLWKKEPPGVWRMLACKRGSNPWCSVKREKVMPGFSKVELVLSRLYYSPEDLVADYPELPFDLIGAPNV